MGPLGLRSPVAQRSPRAQPSTAQRGLRAPPSTSGPSGAVSGSGAIRKRTFSSELRSSKSPAGAPARLAPYPRGGRSRSHARGRLDIVHTGRLASPKRQPPITRVGGANTPGAAPRCSSRATIREAPVDTPSDPIAVVVQLAQSGRSPLRCASRLRIAWMVSIGGARCSRQLAIQPSGQAVIADDQCSGTRARFLPAPLLRRKSGGRFDGSAFEQVGSGPFREPSVGAGAGDVDGHLLGQSCDLA